MIHSNCLGTQFGFLKGGSFPSANLAIAEASKDAFEPTTIYSLVGVAENLTGPVTVINGYSDALHIWGTAPYR